MPVPVPGHPDPVEDRIVGAALECFGRYGLAKTTMEDIARRADVSRATLYRRFTSKDDVVRGVITSEAARVFAALDRSVRGVTDPEDALTLILHGLAHEIATHGVLQRLMATEGEIMLPYLTLQLGPVVAMVAGFVRPVIAGLVDDDNLDAAGDYVARMLVSYASQRSGSLDTGESEACREIVRNEILGAMRH